MCEITTDSFLFQYSIIYVITPAILLSHQGTSSPDNSTAFKQSCTGASRKFEILFRNEEVDVGDIFVYRIHMLVDSNKVKSFILMCITYFHWEMFIFLKFIIITFI